jgi:hypothetical protein
LNPRQSRQAEEQQQKQLLDEGPREQKQERERMRNKGQPDPARSSSSFTIALTISKSIGALLIRATSAATFAQ